MAKRTLEQTADRVAPTTEIYFFAEALDIDPDDVKDYLRNGDLVRNLREAVRAIEEHPVVSSRGDYGMILFRNEAYRYRLSPQAANLFRL